MVILPHAWYISTWREATTDYGEGKIESVRPDQIAAYANVSYLGQFNKYPHWTSSGIRKNAH